MMHRQVPLVAVLVLLATGCSGGGAGEDRLFAYDVPVSARSPWPMMRRTRMNDGASPIDPARARAGGEPWRFSTGKGIFSVPVIGEDASVLVGSADRNFYSIRPDGTLGWVFPTGEIIDSAAAVGSDGTITFGSGDGHVYALAPDGTERWRFAAHHAVGSPDAGEGSRCSTLPPQGGPSNWFEGNVVIGPGGRLYAGNDNFRLYGLDPLGNESFAFFAGPLPFGVVWSAATTRLDGSAVFGGMDFFVYAAGASGECLWRKFLGAPVSASPAQARDGTLYVGSWDGKMYALDGGSGEIRWQFPTREHVYGSAAVGRDGTVYFGSTDGSLYALDPDGNLAWTYDVIDPIRSSPAVAGDGTIFFGAGNGGLYALHPDGTRAWSYDSTTQDRNDLNSSPALGVDRIYIGSEDGTLVGFPYGYCAGAADPRCSTDPGSDLGDDGASLYYVTPGGRSFLEVPDPVQRGSVLAFRLLVRQGGRTVKASLDTATIEAAFTPPVPFDVVEQAGGQWVNFVPRDLLSPGTAYSLALAAGYRTEDGGAGRLSRTFAFRTVGEDGAVPPRIAVGTDAAAAWELRNLSPYQPPVIVSLNQIGFDSVDFLGSVIHEAGGRFVFLLVAGKQDPGGSGTTVIDPATPSLVAMDGVLDRASFEMDGLGLTLVTGGPPIKLDEFRVASQFDAEGRFDAGASVFAEAGCSDLGAVGAFLYLFRLCNGAGDFVSVGTIRGAPYDGAANRRPAEVRVAGVRVLEGPGYRVQATFEAVGYPLADHLPAIILVDEASGRTIRLDYRAALASTADARGNLATTTLALDQAPAPAGARLRAIVVTDLFPLASVLLE